MSDKDLCGNALIAWNHAEFEVQYQCLADEVRIGEYYLRLLLEKEDSPDSPIRQSYVLSFKQIFFTFFYCFTQFMFFLYLIISCNISYIYLIIYNFIFRYAFFNDLYHRFLLTAKPEMKCICLQAMSIVYGRHYEDIGPFSDTKYIVNMLERVY